MAKMRIAAWRVPLVYDCAYNGTVKIEFHPKKAVRNLKNHGVEFDEAASCLLDPRALVREDA